MQALKQHFDIINLVSSSRDSDVFLTRKKETGEHFLLKSLNEQKDASGESLQRKIRFRKEVDTVSSFDHPNIARPTETFADETTYSILYPYRQGTTLAKICESKKALAPEEALLYAHQILDALEYIHARGIIHCDLNPHNLYINEEKGLELLDFGLSMLEEEARKLPEGRIIGTLPYLSPEQMGFTDFKIDSRSDLFCTGIMLYRMIGGSLPFPDYKDSLEELLKFTLKTEVKPVKNIPAYLNTILLKSLRPTPDDRYQTASGFKHDVEQAMLCIKEEGKKTFTPGERDAILAASRSRTFVGRDAEIDALYHGLDQLERGKGSSFLIFGRSGVGKTEVVNRFKMRVNEEKIFFLSSKCNRFSSSQPYSVVRHVVLQLLSKISFSGLGEKERFREILQKDLADYSGVICSIIPELQEHFEKVGEIDKVEKEKETERIIHVLSQLFASISLFRQSIIFVDDFQWIDQISFEVLKKFLGTQPACMLVISFRTEKSDAEIFAHGTDLRKIGIKKILGIKPFSRMEIKELISSRIGDIQDAEVLNEALCTKTDGNPFTVSEAMQYLVNSSILKPSLLGWVYSKTEIESLPEKFDPVSLVLSRLEKLNENEKRYLMLASLIQGKIETSVLEKIGEFEREEVSPILRKLENLGFIIRKSEDAFYFVHDRVQESIGLRVAKEDAFALNEKIALVYEDKMAANRDMIFNAAEYYLKSKNLVKAIEICYEAARYASEKVVFEIATRYFKNTSLMASQCPSLGLPVPVDLVKVQMEFGNVLMMTGRNQQALNIYLKLHNSSTEFDENVILEIKFKIGSIYHNMGEFANSIRYFTDALHRLKIDMPVHRINILFQLSYEAIVQIFHSLGLKYLLKRKKDPKHLLIVKILNMLTYSLYFQDMLLCLQIHLRAMNLADLIDDSFEKVQTYAAHMVPSFQMLLRKRSFNYLHKSIDISNKIRRRDILSFTESFGGLINFYDAKWKVAEKYLSQSIEDYKSVGDFWGQLAPLEHLGYVAFYIGNFTKSKEVMNTEERRSIECNDIRGVVLAKRVSFFIAFLEDKNGNADLSELKEKSEQIKDSLVRTMTNISFATISLLLNDVKESFNISLQLNKTIKEKHLNQEYIASAYSTHCEILIAEKRNRLANESSKQLDLSEKKLLKDLILNSRKALFQGIVYPAHLGAALRCLAWYNAFKGRHRIAKYFFLKAIKKHHILDMRYEEAKSLRDYGLFLEDCSLPGLARDRFNAAYKLFHQCGAVLETERLKGKADIVVMEYKKEAPSKTTNPQASMSEVSQLRIDTLYEMSASMKEIDNIDELLKQILSSMIKATGAQYGCIFLDGNEDDDIPEKAIGMNFDGAMMDPKEIHCSDKIIEETRAQKSIVLIKSTPDEDFKRPDTARVRSVLCVPLCHGEYYLGCVYLGNDMVSGLFSESAKKAAQILSVQADVLLHNAYLMDEFKRLNRNLEKKVKEQTSDIEEKNKQLQNFNVKVVESERMKDILGGTIVHDIKNYTSGIEGNATLLARQYPNDPKILKTTRIVSDCCLSIVSLASNLLDIGKMEDGKLTLKKEMLTRSVLFDMADQLKQNVMFEEKSIAVSLVDKTNDLFAVEADFYLIERVMQNIFSNAAKYVPKGGKVILSLDITNDEHLLMFFNSGNPIPDEEKGLLFDKYARVDSKGSQYSKGLGLFFCKMVMTAHNGRIWLDTDDTGNYFKLAFRGTNAQEALAIPGSIGSTSLVPLR
jgi:signal transduction histidine kinase/tRNA A-37 threonylcarbamoyl transferase component Bud32/tetratricopeptide (TPR) repeat protein